jgi:eukaryotic-like serine/threonine-protein kinase
LSNARWERIQDLYHAAIERPEGARADFLSQACAGDADMLAEVQSLLDQPVSAEQFLESAPVRPGQKVGAYVVDTLLGRGGMGEVYRARDTKLGRDVAIKVLPPLFTSDPGRVTRFQREARLLASLNHPNIGAIYGVDDSDGVVALILELVEGETLADRSARGPVPPAEVVAIARQIAEALEAAHEKGIIHRDLKPANIKRTPGGTIKVLDFGLAKVLARADGDAEVGATHDVIATAFREAPSSALRRI